MEAKGLCPYTFLYLLRLKLKTASNYLISLWSKQVPGFLCRMYQYLPCFSMQRLAHALCTFCWFFWWFLFFRTLFRVQFMKFLSALGRVLLNFCSLKVPFLSFCSFKVYLSALGQLKWSFVSALWCQNWDVVPAVGSSFNCSAALGKILSVGPPPPPRHVN